MANIDLLQGNERINESYQKINQNDSAINEQLVNHIDGSADKHGSDAINNQATRVSGQNVSNAIDELALRIDGLSPGGGDVNDALAVYKTTDNANTNTYVATITNATLIDNFRLNLEVTNSNTDESTLAFNGGSPIEIGWYVDGVFRTAEPHMIVGITELQYKAAINKWVILTKEGTRLSSEISQTKNLDEIAPTQSTHKGVAADLNQEGISIRNTIENTEAENTTGVSLGAGSVNLTVSNGEFSFDGNGDSTTPNILISAGEDGYYRNNDKVHAKLRAYIPEGVSAVGITFRDTVSNISESMDVINNPSEGYHTLEGVIDLNSDSELPRIQVIWAYPTASESNGKNMRVDTKQGISMTNITREGLESKTDQEINDLFADGILQNGINSAYAQVKSTGKNQLNDKSAYVATILSDGSILIGQPSDGSRHVYDSIRVKAGDVLKAIPSQGTWRGKFVQFDINGNLLDYSGLISEQTRTIVSGAHTMLIESDNDLGLNPQELMIIYDGQNEDYVEYLEVQNYQGPENDNELMLKGIGSVKDSYDGESIIRRIYPFDELLYTPDNIVLSADDNTTNYWGIRLILPKALVREESSILAQNYNYTYYSTYAPDYQDADEKAILITAPDTRGFFMKIPKSEISGSITVDKAKQWFLDQNVGFQMIIEDSERITVELPPFVLPVEPGGTIEIVSNIVAPLNYKVPLNMAGTIDLLRVALAEQAEYVLELEQQIENAAYTTTRTIEVADWTTITAIGSYTRSATVNIERVTENDTASFKADINTVGITKAAGVDQIFEHDGSVQILAESTPTADITVDITIFKDAKI